MPGSIPTTSTAFRPIREVRIRRPGCRGRGLWDVRRMLGLDLRWLSGGSEVAGQIGSVINAAVAVSSGIVDHVLCFRSVWESTNQMEMGRAAAVMGQRTSFDDDAARGPG